MTGPIVIKLGGRALDEADTRAELWDAIARLGADAPGGLVILHGGGSAVDAHLARLGLASDRRAGLRVTPDDHIGEVVGVLRGRVNTQLVGLLAARGVRAVGLGLSDGGACVCVKHEPGGVDLGRVGRVGASSPGRPRAGRRCALAPAARGRVCPRDLVDRPRQAPVCRSMSMPTTRRWVSRACSRASVLVLLTDVPGILDGSGSLLSETDTEHIERLIASGVISGGMIPKARAAAAGADASGVPTVIASWSQCDRLAGLARAEPVGTRVLPTRPTPVGPAR